MASSLILKFVFFICFSSPISSIFAAPCYSGDLAALREFAGNLTAGGVLSAWPGADAGGNDASCCNWGGITCSGTGIGPSNSRRVTELRLPGRRLEGIISASLANLDQLRLLDLSGNLLAGGVPRELSALVHLQFLDLSFNALTGPPANLSGMVALRSANLSSNTLNGSLLHLGAGGGLPNLTNLNISHNTLTGPDLGIYSNAIRVLDISMNLLSGPLGGDCLSNCIALEELYLDGNFLSGNLPDSLFDLPQLELLSVPSNKFSGGLSEELGKLSRLKTLVLSDNRLSGPLPDVFGNLTSLEHLVIDSNLFSGGLSKELGKLSWLKTLSLSDNRLSGPLPDVFGNLTLLEHLVIDSNLFSGSLPSSLSMCSMLKEIDIRNNSLTGMIDIDFSAMPLLGSLDLATNHLRGPLPSSLSYCQKLKTLSLAKNNLSGQIPVEYRNLSSLAFLSLSNNSFSNISGALSVFQGLKELNTLILTKNFHEEEVPRGSIVFQNLMVLAVGNCGLTGQIPIWLQGCKKLQVLDLSWNRLSGTIPSWVGEFKNLIYLDISNNSLTGEIPKSLTGLKSLVTAQSSGMGSAFDMPLYIKRNRSTSGRQYNQLSSFPPSLYLNDNAINGTVWPEFGLLKELHVLDLSNNNISGTIPDNLSEMENLEVLDLSHNYLSGVIPDSLSRLTFLSKFSVAHNQLVGAIPNGGQFFTFSNSSFEANPGLYRDTYSCNKTGASAPSPEIPRDVSNKIGKGSILGITFGIGLGIAFLLAVILINIPRRVVGDPADEEDVEDRPQRSSDSTVSKLVLFYQNSDTKELTIADLLKSTNNFDQANIVGCGGFGLVYKASLPDGTKAAVKKLSGDCGEMEREFHAEVEALSRAQHKNLVSLKGYCKLGNDRLLIYSYMENGSLDYWLHERVDGGACLLWESRLRIAQGSARGLAYLHKICEPHIIHRDVKSSNILLDDKFEAHLADFGLSRLIRPYDTHVTTDLVGTLGYIPPEYSQTLIATLKGDVYSFGVVLLELLTGRRPVDVCKGRGCRDLVSWVFQMKSEKKEEQIFDPSIWSKAREKQLLIVLETACKCISPDPRYRPSIEQVVLWLDGVGANT